MPGRNGGLRRLLIVLTAAALAGAGCGGKKNDTQSGTLESTTTSTVPRGSDTVAARLHSNLNGLLQEHVALAASATGAAVGGRTAESAAAGGALDANSDALTAEMTAVLGAQPGKAFDALWKQHAATFKGAAGQAAADADTFPSAFGTFVNSALPNVPAAAIADLVRQHVTEMRTVIDAQTGGDDVKAYTALRTAMDHVDAIASALASGIAAQFPEKVSGDPKSPAATLLNTLNGVLREHVFLTTAATGAALGGRQGEYTAAAAALDANSAAVTAAVAGVYGPKAGSAFDPLWKQHIAFFVDYTTGLAAKDKARQDKAIGDLLGYTQAFGAFVNQASPALAPDTVAELIKTHVFTVKDAIDAQAAGDETKAYDRIRTAAAHMSTIATPLVAAIVKQFPQNY
jgi:hypothetical protein